MFKKRTVSKQNVRTADHSFDDAEAIDESSTVDISQTEAQKPAKIPRLLSTTTPSSDMFKTSGSFEPPKEAANAKPTIKTSIRVDYQPDTCKDFKETGWCGYGDTCIYAHIRDEPTNLTLTPNFSSGDQKDKETKKKKKQELPFACWICRKPFVDPVVTKCNHYFCESCALKRYANVSKQCAACGADTLGIFNTAHELLEK